MTTKANSDLGVRYLMAMELAGLDESTHAYRRLDEALDHHAKTFKRTHTLRPLGVVMAGENEFGPYRD